MLAYVFEKSTLDEIYATIFPDNGLSIKVADKLGMTFEKQKRDADGTYTSYYMIRRGR